MRLFPLALATSMALWTASCAGHDPLVLGDAGPDAAPAPDGPPWQAADAAADQVALFDQAPDLSRPLDLGRDLPRDGSAQGSGLDRARPVASLSDVELGRLCDWGLAQLGGYGTTLVCTDGTQIRNSPNRQACIAGHDRSLRCIATVGDSEDCLRAIGTNGCSQALFLTPACRAMFSCQGA